MEKIEYLILEDDDITEKALSDGEKIEMFYSQSDIWSEHIKGEKIGHIKDDGHSIKIKIGGHKLELGYDTYCYLRNLIVIKDMEDGQACATTEIIKKI